MQVGFPSSSGGPRRFFRFMVMVSILLPFGPISRSSSELHPSEPGRASYIVNLDFLPRDFILLLSFRRYLFWQLSPSGVGFFVSGVSEIRSMVGVDGKVYRLLHHDALLSGTASPFPRQSEKL